MRGPSSTHFAPRVAARLFFSAFGIIIDGRRSFLGAGTVVSCLTAIVVYPVPASNVSGGTFPGKKSARAKRIPAIFSDTRFRAPWRA